MFWLFPSLLTALLESGKDVLSKKKLLKFDEYIVAWSLNVFSLLIVAPLLIFFKIPSLTFSFWSALFVSGIINIITTILYMKAIKYSDLSITVPLLAFTPLFLLITSPILIKEYPNIIGALGVFLIITGSYLLNVNQLKKGLFEPIKSLLKNRGSKYMLIIALLWSISSIFDKIAVVNSSPVIYIVITNIFVTLSLTPIVIRRVNSNKHFFHQLPSLIPIGMLNGVKLVIQMWALTLTLVAYVIAIKRLSGLFGVLMGYFIFKEKRIKERFIGALVMIIGALLISFSG